MWLEASHGMPRHARHDARTLTQHPLASTVTTQPRGCARHFLTDRDVAAMSASLELHESTGTMGRSGQVLARVLASLHAITMMGPPQRTGTTAHPLLPHFSW